MMRTQYVFYWLSLSFVWTSCASQHYTPHSSSITTKDLCSVANEIVRNSEVVKTLALAEVPQYYASIRIFTPGVALDSCVSNLGVWRVQYLDELRPSLNTGYHRDIVIYERSDLDPIEYHVYLASYENYENRQTTYLLRFVGTNADSLSLIGFAEYTEH